MLISFFGTRVNNVEMLKEESCTFHKSCVGKYKRIDIPEVTDEVITLWLIGR